MKEIRTREELLQNYIQSLFISPIIHPISKLLLQVQIVFLKVTRLSLLLKHKTLEDCKSLQFPKSSP